MGYFAESGETAVYESLARREATTLSLDIVAKRALLALQTTEPLRLLDLRFHASAWPVLQSTRYRETRGLSLDARDMGYQGIVYRSAQQYGSDCYAIFGAEAMETLRLQSRVALVNSAGAIHRSVADAVRGSQIPLTP